MSKKQNYSKENIEVLVSLYVELGNDGFEGKETLVEKYNAFSKEKRTKQQLRGKLVSLGEYVPKVTVNGKTVKMGPSKKEMLRILEKMVGFDTSSLEGATKIGIASLIVWAGAQSNG